MKKVIYLILALTLSLTMMPTFAASNSGAEELYAYGFIIGSDGDLMVDTSLTRAEMAVILSELFGVKEEAANYTLPSSFTDVADHWAANYIAYGKAAGWYNGYPDGTYRPEGVVSGNELSAFILNALGYKGEYEYAEATDLALTLGIDVPSNDALLRGDAFDVIWTTVNTPAKGSDVSLGIELGKLEGEEEEEEEVIVVVPDELEVVSVDADNLIQAIVVFNQPVDETTAEDIENYEFDDSGSIADADLQDDGVTVILTLEDAVDQDTDDTITIENVLTEDEKTEMDDTELDINFVDNTPPEVESVEVVGINKIKVIFSEPMNTTANDFEDLVEVNDGDYYIKDVEIQNNMTEYIVETYSDLDSDRIPFKMLVGAKDFVNLVALGDTYTLRVTEDTEAPSIVGYESATQRSVVLIWSEDIKLVDGDTDLYYHTNSGNTIKSTLSSSDIDGNKMTLVWDEGYDLPSTAYVYVAKEAVEDLWENENAKESILVSVDIDDTPPELTSIEIESEDEIVLIFDEDINEDTVSRYDFTVLDDDDDKISERITVDSVDENEVTLTFSDSLDEGKYTIEFEEFEDLYGNEIDADSATFKIEDVTGPDLDAITATLFTDSSNDEFTIRLDFDEAMSTSGTKSITNAENYMLSVDGTWYDLSEIDDVDLVAVDNKEALEIVINADDLEDATGESEITAGSDMIVVGRLEDANGNASHAYASDDITIEEQGTVDIQSVELIDPYKLLVTFDGKIYQIEEDDFIFSTGDSDALSISSISEDTNSDGDSEVTFRIYSSNFDGFKYDASNAYFETVRQSKIYTINSYEAYMTAYDIDDIDVEDKLAPALKEDDDVDDDDVDDVKITDEDEITLTFTEDIDEDYISYSTFSVGDDDEFDIEGIKVDDNEIIITVDLDGDELKPGIEIIQNTSIRDMNGNKLTDIETEIGDFSDNYEY